MNFTHLHVHTEYSLLDGSNKIKEYVARVKELGMDSAAITDHGVMFGVIDFYRAAKEAGIADEDMIRDTEALFRISLKAQQGDVKAAEFLAKLRGELGSDNPFAGVSIESVTINFGKKDK